MFLGRVSRLIQAFSLLCLSLLTIVFSRLSASCSSLFYGKTSVYFPWFLITTICSFLSFLLLSLYSVFNDHRPSPVFFFTLAGLVGSSDRSTLQRTASYALVFCVILFTYSPTPFRMLVGSSGLEPPTSRLSGARSNQLSYEPSFAPRSGGDDGIRTHDPLLAGQVLSQLSYTPI